MKRLLADTTPLRDPAYRRLWSAGVVTTIGAKAEKGIRHSSQEDIEQLFHDRKDSIITLAHDHTRSNGLDMMARQFMDIYASLVKNG